MKYLTGFVKLHRHHDLDSVKYPCKVLLHPDHDVVHVRGLFEHACGLIDEGLQTTHLTHMHQGISALSIDIKEPWKTFLHRSNIFPCILAHNMPELKTINVLYVEPRHKSLQIRSRLIEPIETDIDFESLDDPLSWRLVIDCPTDYREIMMGQIAKMRQMSDVLKHHYQKTHPGLEIPEMKMKS